MSAESLYTEIILTHNRLRHNHRDLVSATAVERGHNPSCGDDLTLLLQVNNDIIVDASYLGSGCAISQASMSIMIDQIKGVTVEEAKKKTESFFKLIHGDPLSELEQEALGDAALFESLGTMPARVKCGTLGWHCLLAALPASTMD